MIRTLRMLFIAVLASCTPSIVLAQADAEPDTQAPDGGDTSQSTVDSASQKDDDTPSDDRSDDAFEKPKVDASRKGASVPSSGSSDFRIVYAPPGCLDSSGDATFSLGTVLERHFEINNGDVYRTSYGPAALSNGPESIFPDDTANDAARVNALAEAGELDWQVVEEDFPALVSPWETMVQIPYRGHFDWLSIVESQTAAGGRFADTERVEGRLLRAELPDGRGLYRFDHPDAAEDPIFVRKWVTTYDIAAPDDAVQIVSIGESLGRGSRVRPTILDRLEEGEPGASIVLHAGAVVDPQAGDDKVALCGESARGLNPMALVPRRGELALGTVGLSQFAKSYGLRYVAANLVDRTTGERPFRRFSVLNLDGLTIAVIGVVGSDQLASLPRDVRRTWRLTDPVEALARARVDLETQLQRKADLTVVLLSTDDGFEFSEVSSVPGVDIVVGPFDRADLVPFEETTDIVVGEFRERRAAVRVGGNPYGVGEIVARFDERDGTFAPSRFVHRVFPVRDSGPIDANLHRSFLPTEEARAVAWSVPILPDLVPIFDADRSIAERAVEPGLDRPPRGFSDGLWTSFVGNELRQAFGVDVAIVSEQYRPLDLVGALTAGQLREWLDDTTQVRLVTLSGTELSAIAEHNSSGESAGYLPLYFSGFDPSKGLVEGRPLRANLPYRVLVTDDLITRDELDDVFGDERFTGRFEWDGRWKKSRDGRVITVEEAILRSLGDDVVPAPELRRRLSDPALVRDKQWRFDLREVSIRGQSRTNFGDQDYGQTRENPVRVPNAFELGYRLDALLTFDGPNFAWDLSAFTQFDRLTFGEPEQQFEPYDEILIATEARANAWAFEVGDAGFPLIPALNVAYDTEATRLPDATDPGNDLSRQQLVRVLPSLVAFPGDYLRRVSVGPVTQLDMVDGGAHVGIEGAYEVVFPIVGALEFESTTVLRYLFPGASDDAADLALRLDSRNALVHPLARGLAMSFYADLYLVQGQTDPNNGLGGLFSAGASFEFSEAFRF